MKTIIIMRHGEAEPLCQQDELRTLTNTGKAEARAMGVWLSKQPFQPDAALISPYTRAQQTAAEVLACNPVRYQETCKDIIPSGNASVAIDYLETLISMQPQCQSWLLVSHMPIVSYLVDQLCPGELPIFQPAAAAIIEYHETTRQAVLLTLKVPSQVCN
ncbi:phosphohistidine phosphatase SixA [Pseudoalteromonas fenneropenaei]|uniref:Phosphohistidine phosphatase SixA n=1 Tax=Pseudoalteromonas fenneropenaei TaxID=1737459 RepID=A0ABV7CCL6_9GAMM